MKSTVGKVSAIMILLAFILASALAIGTVNAQVSSNETIAGTLHVSSQITISDGVSIELNETFNETSLSDGFNEIETVEQNDTAESNETAANDTISNDTVVEEPDSSSKPTFNVDLDYPSSITRGEDIVLVANLSSDMHAKSVYLRWVLPQGMIIASGSETEVCGDLDVQTQCTSSITVRTEMSVLGLSNVRVVVTYEE